MLFPDVTPVTIPVVKEIPTRTYKMNLSTRRMIGHVDGINAMVQAYDKIFNTDRFAYPIYTGNYGFEVVDLYGQDMDYCLSVLEQRIREAVFADDRTVQIKDMSLEATDTESITVTAHIVTTEGEVALYEEVDVSGNNR